MATEPAVKALGRPATEIAGLVRGGSIAPGEVVRAHLEQIDRLDPGLGAFQVVRREKAVAEADELASRGDLGGLALAGVPIPIKDNIPVAGEPMRDGTTAMPDTPAGSDHEVVRRLRAA